MQKFYQRLKENQKERARCAFLVLYFGVLAVLLLFAWVMVDEPFRDSFYRAMAVLVAASPCALAIATPSAVLSGIARAARGGVLVKGAWPIQGTPSPPIWQKVWVCSGDSQVAM